MASKHCFLLSSVLSFILLFLFPLMTESHLFSSLPSHFPKNHFMKMLRGCQKGQRIKGLHQLKRYLQKFGYLSHHSLNTNSNNNDNDNDDDFFDNSLESAIKTYQLNYHLNVSGTLDADTIKQMAVPRCGVPDIVHGRNIMHSGKERRLGSTGFHVVSHFSFFNGLRRWPSSKTHLTYVLLNTGRLDGQTLRPVFSGAFDKRASVSRFTFEETQNADSADIRIGFFSREHGDGRPFDGSGGEFSILAHAFAPTNGRFHLDADENWSTDLSPNSVDVESVAVHEIGHLLGLHHSDDENAIMFPTIPSGVKKINLNQDDIDGIHALYNRP